MFEIGDYDEDGVSTEANPLTVDAGNYIQDISGNKATLETHAIENQEGHRVEGLGLSITDATASESNNFMEFVAQLTPRAPRILSVDAVYTTADGTAIEGVDYTAADGKITFEVGDASKTIRIPLTDNNDDDGDRTFTITLSTIDAELTDGEATGTILDNDDSLRTDGASNLAPSVPFTVKPHELSVADAGAEEGVDETMTFIVTLSPSSTRTVTVDYATTDDTAKAGEDYTVASGTLTFAPGDTKKTVEVAVLDDAKDEDRETFTLRLSNASGAALVDAEAVGAITNNDPMPKAWLAWFGSMATQHALDAVEEHLASTPDLGLRATVAGQRVDPQGLAQLANGRHRKAYLKYSPTLDAVEIRSVTARELVASGSFRYASEDTAGEFLTAWGRGSFSSFEGRKGSFKFDGKVTTGTLGADHERGGRRNGFAVSYSEGDGTYSTNGSKGRIDSSLVGIYPYLRYEATDRLGLWGTLGYGEGSLTLTGSGEKAIKADIRMKMGGGGVRSELMWPTEVGGFTLALEADALLLRLDSERVPNLLGAKADVNRLRIGLDGSKTFNLDGGMSLTPSLEIGIRHDGGDAGKGAGLALVGGLRYAGVDGLTGEMRFSSLLAHEMQGYEERGVSGTVRYDPAPLSAIGPSLSISLSRGGSTSGAESLFADIAKDGSTPVVGLNAEYGYGASPVPGLSGALTPYSGVSLLDGELRQLRLGARFQSDAVSLSLEGERRENVEQAPEQCIMLRGFLNW